MLRKFPEFTCCYCALLVHSVSVLCIICSHILLMVCKLAKHSISEVFCTFCYLIFTLGPINFNLVLS